MISQVSQPRLKGFRFPRSVISYAVWAYHRFALSLRDVEDLLSERGVIVSYESIRAWCQRFGTQIAAEIRHDRPVAADSRAELYASECVTREAARRFDMGLVVSTEAAAAKMLATESVGRIADRAVQILGGAGYMAEYPVERIYRDVRLLRIYEGTTQIQQLIIARNLLRDHQAGTRL
ncbi:Acyl-CoA dehydrogenase, C-terminal domain [Pseudosulfitobacter pseudonitzschiae]|uniref:acyl-CoA dehydrogenase family protein n=1 Tax=Pseudosulfitobacter pseudonitzschiae TaxID=1402135 RepID=UPI00068FC283|nr:acyl-CoA dehydrogenase family protein [Pseudosulfitobacter pseudonitzschiae]QKS11032.1 hypothetical protein HT745_20815 [Pseudosulfitobacter pseudonitzschiae]SHG05780.1 Acyl-CoA dehydrogenase, C-terminal domain [Pseudosulfitobacter pseudonitzschiae]